MTDESFSRCPFRAIGYLDGCKEEEERNAELCRWSKPAKDGIHMKRCALQIVEQLSESAEEIGAVSRILEYVGILDSVTRVREWLGWPRATEIAQKIVSNQDKELRSCVFDMRQ